MHEMANTLSFKRRTKRPSLHGLRVQVVIDLQAKERLGCWRVRGASFVGIPVPFDRMTSTGARYADLPAECASALGIVVGATLPAPAMALFLKPDPRGGMGHLGLLRAIAAVLEGLAASLRVEICRADDFYAVETSDIFSGALQGVDQLLSLVESQTKPIVPMHRMS
jgi:DNA-binding ferritin-like protein